MRFIDAIERSLELLRWDSENDLHIRRELNCASIFWREFVHALIDRLQRAGLLEGDWSRFKLQRPFLLALLGQSHANVIFAVSTLNVSLLQTLRRF